MPNSLLTTGQKMSIILDCIAVDDEPLALSILRKHAGQMPFLNLLSVFSSGTEALAYLQHNPVNVVFLDIDMPDLSGIQLARLIQPNVKIIFTTAYYEHAVTGFEIAAVDYLLKPIGFERFFLACTRARAMLTPALQPQPATSNFLFVKDGYSLVRINLEELLIIEADDNYLTFYEPEKKTLTRMTLSEALVKLPEKQFVRVHKSYIISVSKIEKIERHQVQIGNKAIPISSTYRQALMDHIG
jgi:DNA-binding LytR/AlgR family response regulator